MINTEFREALARYLAEEEIEEEVLLLDNHAYDNSIIGLSLDHRVIYDYEKMIEEYVLDEECTEEEAIEWLEYNTLRAIGYFGERAPIIVGTSANYILDIYKQG